MVARFFWPRRNLRSEIGESASIDSFWVEATEEEACQLVYPMAAREVQSETVWMAAQCERLAKTTAEPHCPFCFLVARNLSRIDPFPVHYPFHPLRNGYSPFRSIPQQSISCLEQLAGISVDVNS
jgi:hypothetical protein